VLTQIDVMSDTVFELPILGVTPKSSLLLQKVTGLNPPDRSLFIGDYSQDGGIYQGRRVGARNVVFTINLNPNPAFGETVASLRQNLYKAFIDPQVDGDYLKFVLHDDTNAERYLVGYCEKFEADPFDSETMCQVSLICPDPYIRDNQDTILEQPTGWITVPFTYEGTAETGFIVRIYITTPTNYLTLYNNGKTMKLWNPDGYAVGDLVIINTIRGQRSITVTKPADVISTPTEFNPPNSYALNSLVFYNGAIWKAVSLVLSDGTTMDMAPGNYNNYWQMVSTPIISQLSASSQWLDLHSVANTMRVQGQTSVDVVANIKYLKYTASHWGI
jgi:hypothetical protein